MKPKILEKPKYTDKEAEESMIKMFKRGNELQPFVEHANAPIYLYWDTFKYKKTPQGIKPEDLWVYLKLTRNFNRRRSLIKSKEGQFFSWMSSLPKLEPLLHLTDMQLGGNVKMMRDFSDVEMDRFISRGVMEEAIASSQLEGAHTSRKIAKQMLREGRKPRDQAEQMILNNYNTMLHVESDYKNKSLDQGLLLSLHAELVVGTDAEKNSGRYRLDSDEIVVEQDGIIYHVPPKEKFLIKEMDRLIDYANNNTNDKKFVHPVIKAILIHFWVGYLHPFTDGNGRLARSLFYWYLLKNDYWGFSYLPLSKIIKQASNQYRDAYVYAEQDDFDLTYFIDFIVTRIEKSIHDFELYITEKRKENSRLIKILNIKYTLNYRQIQTLLYLSKNSGESTSQKTHSMIYKISRIISAKDLKELERIRLVKSKKIGKYVHYYATKELCELN